VKIFIKFITKYIHETTSWFRSIECIYNRFIFLWFFSPFASSSFASSSSLSSSSNL
jgi:hypothetical protein